MEAYSFLVKKLSGNKEDAAKLAESLRPFGIQVRFEETRFMDDDDYYNLTLVFDEYELEQRRTRNAGIKVKYREDAYDQTYGSIKIRLDSETQEQVAKSLGMSRMTLYRKLKKAEELGVSEDYPIYML